MKRTMMSWMLVATVFATTAAACGSDDDTKTPTTEAGDGASAEVAAFCQSAKDLGAEFKKVMADPTSGDAAALTSKATELGTKAASLTASATAADSTKIQVCLQEMSTAMTGG